MGVRRLWTTWLLFGGIAAVFAGARVFDGTPALRLPLILAGAAAALAATVLRVLAWRSAPPDDPAHDADRADPADADIPTPADADTPAPAGAPPATGSLRSTEAVFALSALGCVLALAGFLPATQDGFEWLGLDLGSPADERRARRFFLAASSILMACSALPALAAHWAAKKGGQAGSTPADQGSQAGPDQADPGARGVNPRAAFLVDALRIRETAANAFSLALAGGALMLIGYVAAERNQTLDFSYFKTATPGEATRDVVRNLDGQLQVALFFPPLNPVGEQVRTYVQALAAATGNVAIEEHDRFADPVAAAEWGARNDGQVFLRLGERKEQIAFSVEIDDARGRLRVLDGLVQQALLLLARGRRVAYLTTGHGEMNDPLAQDSLAPRNEPREAWMPRDAPRGPREPPLPALRRMLELLNYDVRDLGLRDGLGDAIPDDAAVLMILGPQRPFFDSEAAAVREYLDRGGSLLLALESGSEFRVGDFRQRLGVEHDPVTVVDDRNHMRETGTPADRRLIVANRFSAHPSVTTLSRRGGGGGVLMLGAEPLVAAEDAEGLRHSLVVRSMRSSFADRNGDFRFDEGDETRESLAVAIAVEREALVEGPAEDADEAAEPGADVAADSNTADPDGPAADSAGPMADSEEPTNPAEPPADPDGPSRPPPGMRALVYGDAEIFADRVLVSLQLNAALVADGIRWLGKEESFSGEVVSEEDVPVLHTRSEDVGWFYAIIFGAPGLVLAGGAMALYGRRAKRGATA